MQRLADNAISKQKALADKLKRALSAEIDALHAQLTADGLELSRTQLWKYTNFKSLSNRIDKDFLGLYGEQLSIMKNTLEEVFIDTFGFTLESLGRNDITFNIFTKAQMNKILSESWSGSHYSQRIWVNTSSLARRIRDDITQMIIAGQDSNTIRRRLMLDFDTNYFNVQRLVRTEASYIFNRASMQGYLEAGLQKVEFLLERDNTTCSICKELASKDTGYGKGIYDLQNAPRIPQHPQCRCTYVPIVDIPQQNDNA